MYPEFCKDCWKVEECEQKENMLADTEPVTGYAVFSICDHVCEDCLDTTDDDCAEITSEELDSPAHCCNCGAPLKHQLTSDGVAYVKEAIAEGDGCCRELWPTVWADYLDDEDED